MKVKITPTKDTGNDEKPFFTDLDGDIQLRSQFGQETVLGFARDINDPQIDISWYDAVAEPVADVYGTYLVTLAYGVKHTYNLPVGKIEVVDD